MRNNAVSLACAIQVIVQNTWDNYSYKQLNMCHYNLYFSISASINYIIAISNATYNYT